MAGLQQASHMSRSRWQDVLSQTAEAYGPDGDAISIENRGPNGSDTCSHVLVGNAVATPSRLRQIG